MRLICPNCSAQYEIDASLIPDEGRDVQCSNCGHTWFELPATPPAFADAPEPQAGPGETGESPREPEDGGLAPSAADEPGPEPAAAPEPEPAPAEEDREHVPEPEPSERPAAEAETPVGDDAETRPEADEPSTAARAFAEASQKAEVDTPDVDPFAAAAAAGATVQMRRPVDEAAREILREEAERELSRRRAPPTTTIETQTDMPLETVRGRNTPSRALRARMARSDSEDTPAAPAEKKQHDPRVQSVDDGYEAPRRDLLPDIDEINSSLKSRRKQAQDRPESAAERQRGFRSGFLAMVALAVLMILAYAWAPDIARAVPALETALLNYVDWANGVRDWIDGLIGATPA